MSKYAILLCSPNPPFKAHMLFDWQGKKFAKTQLRNKRNLDILYLPWELGLFYTESLSKFCLGFAFVLSLSMLFTMGVNIVRCNFVLVCYAMFHLMT